MSKAFHSNLLALTQRIHRDLTGKAFHFDFHTRRTVSFDIDFGTDNQPELSPTEAETFPINIHTKTTTLFTWCPQQLNGLTTLAIIPARYAKLSIHQFQTGASFRSTVRIMKL